MGTPRKQTKPAETTVAPTVTLDQVKQATRDGGFVYTEAAFHGPLVELGHVEINPEMTEGDKIATRATFKDENQVTETQTITSNDVGTLPAAITAKVKPVFTIVDNVPEPVKKPRVGNSNAGRDETYPFSTLDAGKGFFVAGKTAKAMTSTVASANARFSEVIPGETRTQTRGKNKGAVVPATRQLRKFTCWDGFAPDNSGVAGVWVKREA